MSLILILGIVVFSIASIYFTLKPKKEFNSAFIVSFVTLISYIIMLQGNFAANDLYWTRWLFYGISCPLLCYEISKKIELPTPKTIFNLFLTFITMITGSLASISLGGYKLAFFGLSCFAFASLVFNFYKTKSRKLMTITPYIAFGWLIFPIVFIFSNEGIFNIIPLPLAAAIYLGLDIFTKIIFYIHHSQVKAEVA